VRIFVAGASGLIGVRLVPLLVAAGHEVAGMTRSPEKVGLLRDLGAEPVVCDVFDAASLAGVVEAAGPEIVFHQLTDLPDNVADMASFGARNDRVRSEGTLNLLAAAAAAGTEQFIAQSISWDQSDEARRAVTARHERAVLQAGGDPRCCRPAPGLRRRGVALGHDVRGLLPSRARGLTRTMSSIEGRHDGDS